MASLDVVDNVTIEKMDTSQVTFLSEIPKSHIGLLAKM